MGLGHPGQSWGEECQGTLGEWGEWSEVSRHRHEWQAAAVPGGERVLGARWGGGGGASPLEQGQPGSIWSPSVTWPPHALLLPPSPHCLTHPNKGVFSEMEYGDPECFRGNWESWACVKFHSFPTALKSLSFRAPCLGKGLKEPAHCALGLILDPLVTLQAAAPYLGAPDSSSVKG